MGRFISPDTVNPNWYDPQSLNRYAYCRNNPLKYVDPTGHDFGIISGPLLVIGGGLAVAWVGTHSAALLAKVGDMIFGDGKTIDTPYKIANEAFAPVLDLHRIPFQIGLEFTRADFFLDSFSAVAGYDLTSLHVDKDGLLAFQPESSEDRIITGLLVGGQTKFEAIGKFAETDEARKVANRIGELFGATETTFSLSKIGKKLLFGDTNNTKEVEQIDNSNNVNNSNYLPNMFNNTFIPSNCELYVDGRPYYQ
jgi:hypothetical protein